MAVALVTNIKLANEFNEEARADSVIVWKTLDTGSTFLDNHVFKHAAHVSRWKKELEHLFSEWPLHGAEANRFAEWFAHRPGEEIVGASINYLLPFMNFTETLLPLFDVGRQGKLVFIQLWRDEFDKWISVMRTRILEKSGCNKDTLHIEPCASRKVFLQPDDLEWLHKFVVDDTIATAAIRETIADSMRKRPDLITGYEKYAYEELVECQGLPARINRHFGNNTNGCVEGSAYRVGREWKRLNEVIENLPDLHRKFIGTPWEDRVPRDDQHF